jgi:hypothetical protein
MTTPDPVEIVGAMRHSTYRGPDQRKNESVSRG